jgi:hypothetical protein
MTIPDIENVVNYFQVIQVFEALVSLCKESLYFSVPLDNIKSFHK